MGGRPILERERELAELAAAAGEAKRGHGSVVLIVGEAGIGKSSLVDAARSVLPAGARLLVGYCDDLATPRVLGPLRDLAVGRPLVDALESGDRQLVHDALRAELSRAGLPTVLVVEDAHWADEATLDVLRFLVRRISDLPAVLVLTYRDDRLGHDHPLPQLLGVASGARRLHRLRLGGLSPAAVRQLGANTGLDSDRVFEVTSGNPFLVTEILASGDVGSVPPTIVEAVGARLQDLDGPAKEAVDRLAVVPSAVERWLVDEVVPGGFGSLAAAEQRGVLNVSPTRVTFRHELIRRAIADSMPTVRRILCNQAVLAALLARDGGVDLSRILHHATEVGDVEVVVRYGPVAAREAVTAGSHREAVAHYQRVLDHRSAFVLEEQAKLLEEYAIECYTVGLADLAVHAQAEAVQLRRRLGDPVAIGLSLRWLSRMYWWAGARPEAEARGVEAIEVLEGAGDRRALALALSNQSQLHVLAGRSSEAIAVGERAVAMARDVGDAGLLSHALNNVGFGYWDQGDPRGRPLLEESLAVALDAGEVDHACRAYVTISWHLNDELAFEEARRILRDAIDLADEAEFLGFLRYLHLTRAMINLNTGAWDEVDSDAEWALNAQPIMRCPSLTVLGRLRVRRGQAGGDELLAEAWEIAQRLGEPQRIAPAATALAEAAWLREDTSDVASVVAPIYLDIRDHSTPANAAELGYWVRRAGAPVPMAESDHPYALLAAGRWREAADRWQRAGCPYEYALALADSPDPADMLAALSTLDALGAEPLARRVRRRLKELGVARIPRGPVPSTRDNPAGLTQRQVEVVRLLADGLSNAEIAEHLVLSIRTVDTHVGAVLTKLDARTRREAVARARSLGVIGKH
jgi:DNA-binding CsgD family transcriptional regulator/tetratricopeptide (TPR) repeat protein